MTFKQIWQYFLQHDIFYIATHLSPDGDALGSAFGLRLVLLSLGKQACVVLDAPLKEDFSYLGEAYLVSPEIPEGASVVALDCGDRARVAGLPADMAIDISIDHHESREDFASLFYVDPTAAATAEILAALFFEQKIPFTKELAACLYTGMATDTGCFQYSNTNAKTHGLVARMMEETGFEPFFINKRLFDTKTMERLYARAFCVQQMEFYFEGRVAFVCVSRESLARQSFSEADLDGLSSLPRSVKGVEVGVLLLEKEDGKIKASLRANGSCDVGWISKQFSGGGHKNASGFTIQRSMDEVKEALLGQLKESME